MTSARRAVLRLQLERDVRDERAVQAELAAQAECEHPFEDVDRDDQWRICTLCGAQWKLRRAEP